MNDNVFVDTNILVYSVSNDLHKRTIADELLLHHDVVISSQVISEFIAVTIRKNILETAKVIEYAKQFMEVFHVVLISPPTIRFALEIMVKYWDALILSTALEATCPVLYTEDLQDGQRIEEKLTILNPFKS